MAPNPTCQPENNRWSYAYPGHRIPHTRTRAHTHTHTYVRGEDKFLVTTRNVLPPFPSFPPPPISPPLLHTGTPAGPVPASEVTGVTGVTGITGVTARPVQVLGAAVEMIGNRATEPRKPRVMSLARRKITVT